jgi:hypothetical protein
LIQVAPQSSPLAKAYLAETCGTVTENVVANKRQYGPQLTRVVSQSFSWRKFLQLIFVVPFFVEKIRRPRFIDDSPPKLIQVAPQSSSLAKAYLAETCGTVTENVVLNTRQHGPQLMRVVSQSFSWRKLISPRFVASVFVNKIRRPR